jgi:hypothetical protein
VLSVMIGSFILTAMALLSWLSLFDLGVSHPPHGNASIAAVIATLPLGIWMSLISMLICWTISGLAFWWLALRPAEILAEHSQRVATSTLTDLTLLPPPGMRIEPDSQNEIHQLANAIAGMQTSLHILASDCAPEARRQSSRPEAARPASPAQTERASAAPAP